MRFIINLIGLLFNPIFMPLVGAFLYFSITPRFTPERTETVVLLALLIITVIVPYIFYLLLRNLNWVRTRELTDLDERKVPLFLCIILILITFTKIVPSSLSNELHYYFVGILITLISCLILLYLNFKASMHMMGICGLLTFVVMLSIHYQTNLTTLIACLTLCSGAVATARLYLNFHDIEEIIIGSLIGIIPQFTILGYWI